MPKKDECVNEKRVLTDIHVAVVLDKEMNVETYVTSMGYAQLELWALSNTPKGKVTYVINCRTGDVVYAAEGTGDFPTVYPKSELGYCGKFGIDLYSIRTGIEDSRFAEQMEECNKAKLVSMSIVLEADIKKESDVDAVIPGGYRLGDKVFDFNTSCGGVENEHLISFENTDFDTGYSAECNDGCDCITALEFLDGDWEEFFVSTEESGVKIKSVKNLSAYFDDGTLIDFSSDYYYMKRVNSVLLQS